MTDSPLSTIESILLIASSTLLATGVISRLMIPALALPALGIAAIGEFGMLLSVAPQQARDHVAIAVVAGIVGIVIAIAGGVVASKHPVVLLCAAAIALPLRVPLDLGDETYNLLLPLYWVIGIGVVAAITSTLRLRANNEAEKWASGPMLAIDACVALFVTIACLSASWSVDVESSMRDIALFIGPFGLLYITARFYVSQGVKLVAPAYAFLGTMLVAAAAGIFQYVTKDIWQNPKLIVANNFTPDFRTNSIFWDPNVYGRTLVVALLLIAAWWAARTRPRRPALAAVALTVMFATALWFTFSQSSFVGLAAALIALTYLVLSRRWRIALGAAAIVLLIGGAIAASSVKDKDIESRSRIASDGLVLAAERPIIGLGVGAFEEADKALGRRRGEVGRRLRASHTTPVTIVAELGIAGLATWMALLVAAGGVVLASARVESERTRLWWAGAVLVAITAHSMLYASFFEDPITWVALAVLASATQIRSSFVEVD